MNISFEPTPVFYPDVIYATEKWFWLGLKDEDGNALIFTDKLGKDYALFLIHDRWADKIPRTQPFRLVTQSGNMRLRIKSLMDCERPIGMLPLTQFLKLMRMRKLPKFITDDKEHYRDLCRVPSEKRDKNHATE